MFQAGYCSSSGGTTLYIQQFGICHVFIMNGRWQDRNGTVHPDLADSHHHYKHQGLNPLIRFVSRVTTVLANVSSVFQFYFFLVVCSDMISKGFGLVAFFASVKTSSVSFHLSCLVCIQSAVHGVRSPLFWGHKGCRLLEVLITSFLPTASQYKCMTYTICCI